jgi:hypothetical protein
MVRNLMIAGLVALVGGLAVAAELKSGPQAGEKLPGPFHPLNVNGDKAGEKQCLYCKFGDSPVAMVFARSADDEMTQKLIVSLDAAAAKNAKAELGTFVVFLTDDDKAADKLKAFADKAKLKNVILAVDNPSGPNKYNVSKDADLTVVLYSERTAKANMAFEKGKLTDKDIEAVNAGISKIIPASK